MTRKFLRIMPRLLNPEFIQRTCFARYFGKTTTNRLPGWFDKVKIILHMSQYIFIKDEKLCLFQYCSETYTPSQRISPFFVPKWTLIFLFYFWVITTIFWGNEMGSSSVVRYVSPLPNISYNILERWNYYCVCVPWKFK